MTTLLTSQRGFGVLLVLTLLPVLLSFFLVVHFIIGMIQVEQRLNQACRQTAIATQNQIIPQLEKILSLNPKAKNLRLREKAAYRQVLATLGTPAAAAAQARLLKIKMQRRVLGQTQTELIRVSNKILYVGAQQGHKALLREQQRSQSLLRLLFEIRIQVHPANIPSLAIRPDFPDSAPVYLLENSFSDKQSLAQDWQYEVLINPLWKSFLQGHFKFKKHCAVTLAKERNQWFAKIHKGKSSPKSPW